MNQTFIRLAPDSPIFDPLPVSDRSVADSVDFVSLDAILPFLEEYLESERYCYGEMLDEQDAKLAIIEAKLRRCLSTCSDPRIHCELEGKLERL